MSLNETIFALASAHGKAGVAVIRVSGPNAHSACVALSGAGDLPPARTSTLAALRYPATGVEIDRALILVFNAPASYTGEDITEFHVHGGRAVVTAVLEALGGLDGLRPAEPGEFTRRAFENGRLDLTEAEAVADLIDAETEAQRRQALRQLDGAFGALCADWRARLLRTLAHLEAVIDFPDEELPDAVKTDIEHHISSIKDEISQHLDDAHIGERIRNGFRVAVTGAPNVGKSTFVNQLVKRDVAIVSEIPGTTRDVIEIQLDLGGYPVTVYDTAGLRESTEEIEREGIRRARKAAETSDVVLYITDVSTGEARYPDELKPGTLVLRNKIDLTPDSIPPADTSFPVFDICARDGTGLFAVMDHLCARVEALGSGASAPVTRLRHRRLLTDCAEALDRYAPGDDIELGAENVRTAVGAIGRITGTVRIEELLNVIFSDFCIGK